MTYSRFFRDLSSNDSFFHADEYRAAGHIIVAIKASEGKDYRNPTHRTWCLHAGLHHVAVIHYHFARPDVNPGDPHGEALHFLRSVSGLLGPRDYVVCDLERATPSGWSHDPAWSEAFDQYVQDHTAYHTILYASRSVLQTSDRFLVGPYKRVWDAAYSSEPDYAPPGYELAFRQFTDGLFGPEPHSLPGAGRGDVNRIGAKMFERIARKAR